MFYACILRSISLPEQRYIGRTADLKSRLAKNNAGEVPHASKVENGEKLLVSQIRFLSFCPAELRVKFSPEKVEELFILYPEVQTIEEKTI